MQQIYSLPPLATREPLRIKFFGAAIFTVESQRLKYDTTNKTFCQHFLKNFFKNFIAISLAITVMLW